MSKTLVIVESPAKAKTIGKYLGPNYHVEASMGHIRDLPKSKLGIDIENNFKPQYITIRGKGELIDNLKKKAKKSSKVLLATDPDREGEAISWHLSKVLDINENDKCRIEFHEITKNAIKNAIKNPRQINENLVNSQQARRILDRLVGYLISPLLWKNVKYGLSAGRVQSVAVRIICDRENEINEFIPQEYWTIHSILSDGKNKFEAKFYGNKESKIEINNEQEADKILDDIKDKEFIVDGIKKGEKKRNPVLPFTTSTMQQEASRKLGFSSKKTMLIAQQLYEGIDLKDEGTQGLITYLRTDSTRISDEAKADCSKYIINNYGLEYTLNKEIKTKATGKIQDAHEAIRPTSILRKPDDIKDSLSKDQYKLYKLIWLRFLASQMAPAVFDTINVDIIAGQYLFKASGSVLKFKGFITVYIEDTDTEEEADENSIPELTVGQKLKLIDIKKLQHFTQPPPRFTEALLIKTLEEKGIGRPSTYATIISTIQDRGYIIKEQKLLKPTELGFIVNTLLNDYFKDIVDIKFTANMENNLDNIEKGEASWINIIRDFYENFDQELKYAQENIKPYVIKDETTDIKCEFCGRNMVIKQGRFGKFLACPGYPECRNTKPIREEAGVLCPLCSGKVLIKKTRKGRTFYGCENNPECKFMTWDKPTGGYCPICGSYLVQKNLKGDSVIKCSNKECNFIKEN